MTEFVVGGAVMALAHDASRRGTFMARDGTYLR